MYGWLFDVCVCEWPFLWGNPHPFAVALFIVCTDPHPVCMDTLSYVWMSPSNKCINVPLICIYVPWNVQMSNHKCDSLMSYVPISILWQNLPVPALPFCSCHFCYIKLLVLFPYGSKVFPVMSKLYSVWPQYCLFCTQLCLLCQYCSQLHWYCSL